MPSGSELLKGSLNAYSVHQDVASVTGENPNDVRLGVTPLAANPSVPDQIDGATVTGLRANPGDFNYAAIGRSPDFTVYQGPINVIGHLTPFITFGLGGGATATIGAGRLVGTGVLFDNAGAAESAVASSESAANVANGVRIAQQLTVERDSALSTGTGELTPGAIANSRLIMQPSPLLNPEIPQGFAKFTTELLPNPFGGSFTTRFYMNPSTGEVFYGLDYKTLFPS